VPTTKPETRYADLLEDKVSVIKDAFSPDVPTPEDFSKELERHISQTIRATAKETLRVLSRHPELNGDEVYEYWVTHKNMHLITTRDGVENTNKRWFTSHINYKLVSDRITKLTDLSKVRARADLMDKLRFVGARFLSTIAIGAAALLMAFVGHEYLGFETALLKKTPQEVVNSPIVISDVISVYDGATFRVNIKGYPHIIGENMPIRVSGIGIPEIKAQCGYEKSLAVRSKYFTTKFLKGGTVELRNAERGKYFRIAADVYVKGVSLGDSLIDAGLAHKYDKENKKDWCEK
jgi:endonuclease YncB( thermonuclease family)